MVDLAVGAVEQMVRKLAAAGGRRFVVFTLPDLGRTPGVLYNDSYHPRGARTPEARRARLSRKLTEVTDRHNAQLRAAVKRLRHDLPTTTILITDMQGGGRAMIDGRSPDQRHRFDWGLDTRTPRRTVRDRSGTIAIQDKCYHGGYLGSGDPAAGVRRARPRLLLGQRAPDDRHALLDRLARRPRHGEGGLARRAAIGRGVPGSVCPGGDDAAPLTEADTRVSRGPMDTAAIDHLLTTTRSVRKRLDFSRPVPPEVIERCLEIAIQAPTGSNQQGWSFLVVTDADKKKALADLYREAFAAYAQMRAAEEPRPARICARSRCRASSTRPST